MQLPPAAAMAAFPVEPIPPAVPPKLESALAAGWQVLASRQMLREGSAATAGVTRQANDPGTAECVSRAKKAELRAASRLA
jgi:hypothetical protein